MPHHHGARKARKVRSKSRKPHRESAPPDRKPDVDFDLADDAKADAVRWMQQRRAS